MQSLVLRDYEDILPVVDIYSLLGLASSASNTYGICSKVKTSPSSGRAIVNCTIIIITGVH